jgi:20S proteasome subunit beta 2
VYKDGVVLGADTRATGGAEVVDKNCEKIHYLAPNIWCCGAGTAADTEKTTELIASNLELLRLSTGTQSRVVTANTMLKRMLYKYQGHVSAALVLGGVDVHGAHLYSIHPHGSTQRPPTASPPTSRRPAHRLVCSAVCSAACRCAAASRYFSG